MRRSKISTSIAWSYVTIYAAAIFVWSSLPGGGLFLETLQEYVSDKLLHLLEYLVLGILIARAMGFSYRFNSLGQLVFYAFLMGSIYAMTDEWHQSFVPRRVSSAGDWIADCAGVFIGAYIRASKMKKYIGKESNA